MTSKTFVVKFYNRCFFESSCAQSSINPQKQAYLPLAFSCFYKTRERVTSAISQDKERERERERKTDGFNSLPAN